MKTAPGPDTEELIELSVEGESTAKRSAAGGAGGGPTVGPQSSSFAGHGTYG
jgi:hypothetical protein